MAYGVAPLLRRGIDGRGETVAMGPNWPRPRPGATDIRKDLAAFDRKFGLPPARLNVVTAIARSPTPYLTGGEELGDTEMVHAFAPGATLDIILIPAGHHIQPRERRRRDNQGDPGKRRPARRGALDQLQRRRALLHPRRGGRDARGAGQARDQHVTVLGSSGDAGAISSHEGPPVQVNMPASDPLVLGVGGTILDITPDGGYLGEMAWNDNTDSLRRRLQQPVRPPAPTRAASPGPAPAAASPTCPPTPTPPAPWRRWTATANSWRTRAPAPPPRCGRA